MKNTCQQHRRQLALLSVQALDEPDKTGALAHLTECSACGIYWQQLQTVAGLLRTDAERSIEPMHTPVFAPTERRRPLFTMPRALAFAVGAFALCTTLVLLHKGPRQPDVIPSTVSQSKAISVPTIADSRRLVKDLDALVETPRRTADFVFSVGSRYEGP
jgi:predicted anti-sigma-YlaC factor YlaD